MTDEDPRLTFCRGLVGILAQPAATVDETGQVVSCNIGFKDALASGDHEAEGCNLAQALAPMTDFDLRQALITADIHSDGLEEGVELPSGLFRFSVHKLDAPVPGPLYLCQLTADLAVDSTRLRFLLEHLDQGVWNFNVLTSRFNVTSAWRRMRNIDSDVDIRIDPDCPEKWLAHVHPLDRDRLRDLFTGQVRGSEDSINVQYRYDCGDDDWMWILCRAKVMTRDHHGRPVQIVGLDTDITHLKREEVAQLELTSKLQLAIEVAGIGIWEFDSATKQVHWDDRLLEIYGLDDQLNHRPDNLWETYLHPDDREATVADADAALEENRDFRRDYRILRQSGEERVIRSVARNMAVSGTAGKLLGVNIDVTEDYARTAELERAREQLEHDSRHDALTGLANRRLLDETTQTMLAGLSDDDSFAVLHIDLDHFKQVNDTLGHAAGDQVLVRVAETLRALVGLDGLVCRNGGDEFVVLLERFDRQEDVAALCQSMINQMAEPMILQGRVCHFGLSIGCAIGTGGTADASEVFINADVALYAAKSAGRSCFKMFTPHLRAVTQSDVSMHFNLSSAMAKGQITCHFQPQFDADTLDIIGAEALVRWQCPERGLVLPQDFIPVARATGLSGQLDEYVLDCVLEEQSRWAQAGLHVPTVALNISLERLLQPGLMAQIQSKLSPHHAISFELLETSFLERRTAQLTDVLNDVRQAGIRLDLDDFGSGHSSVVALQALKPDRVKLDRMLIAPLDENPAQIRILSALVEVAELEGCAVVVEGIETQSQLDAVRALKCEAVQGFLLGRPVPGIEFARTLMPRQSRVGA